MRNSMAFGLIIAAVFIGLVVISIAWQGNKAEQDGMQDTLNQGRSLESKLQQEINK